MLLRLLRPMTLGCVLVGMAAAAPRLMASGDIPIDTGVRDPIRPPLPVWPSDYETITDRQPVFRLNGRFQATRYRVELARDEAFTDPITLTDARVAENEGITPVVVAAYTGEPLADGDYFWRAFAGSDDGFWTRPANYRRFRVAGDESHLVEPPDDPVHPRLLIRTDELNALDRRVSRSEHLMRGWQYQLNTALSNLELEPPDETYARGGKGQHGNYSTAASWYHRHLTNTALCALVTSNARLTDKAIEMLMTACAYERWLGPSFDQTDKFDPAWNAALETAMMTEAVAIGYDLLCPHLTDVQSQLVRHTLAENGIRPLIRDWSDPVTASRLPRHQVPTGNWVMVCNGSAGIGALAILGEHPEAAEWVRLARNRTRAWLEDRGGEWYVDNPHPTGRPDPIPVIGPSEPNFGEDGGYKESIGYMNYAMRYVTFFADGLRRTTGEDLFAHVPEDVLAPMAWSIMAQPGPNGAESSIVDFGDCGDGTAWYRDLFAALMRNRRDHLASWLYRRTVPAAVSPRSLLWFDDTVVAEPPSTAVPMGVFRGIGQVMMRSGWSPESPMAAIKFHQNRGHLDIGTFYLYGGGGPTIIDSGVTHYGSKIYGEYSSKSHAHNVVLVDGKSQRRTSGHLIGVVGTSTMTAAAGQLASAYPDALESWTRDLLMLPGNVAVIYDHLSMKKPAQTELVLHPANPFQLIDDAEILIRHDAAKPATHLSVFSDRDLDSAKADGYHKTLPHEYVRFKTAERNGASAFLTVCRWPSDPHHEPEPVSVTPAGSGRWRLDRTTGPARLGVRTGAAGDGRNDWLHSDAKVAAVWDPGRPGKPLHAILRTGTRLAVDEKELLLATHPICAAIEIGLPLRAHFWTSRSTQVTLAADDERLGDLYLDGRRIPVQWHHDGVTFEIPEGESELVASDFARPLARRDPLVVPDLLPVSVPEAPAFRRGIRTRASTSWTDGMDALDGDPNTAWVSLAGVPMPQWLEVILPEPEAMDEIVLHVGLPAAGKVGASQDNGQTWLELGAFATTGDQPVATLSFEPIETARIRVTVERIEEANTAAAIHSLEWKLND